VLKATELNFITVFSSEKIRMMWLSGWKRIDMFSIVCILYVDTQQVNEQILNGTSAQLGYTVPFTSVHAGKYRTEDKLKTDITKN